MKYINIVCSVIWGINFIKYLMGDYNPDSFTIGFLLFSTMMYFALMFIQMNKEKTIIVRSEEEIR